MNFIMKILVVLGNGGHSAEMLQLVEMLGPNYQYSYMIADNDQISASKIQWVGRIYRVPLPREKPTFRRSIRRTVLAIFAQLIVLIRCRPQVILSTGANIAVPISVFGRLLGVKVIHVETGSRIYLMSTTGRIMYHVANLFFVQWEELRENYPNAIYAGRLL